MSYLGITENEKEDEKKYLRFASILDFWHDFHEKKMDFQWFNILEVSLPKDQAYKKAFADFKKEAKDMSPYDFYSQKAEIETILPATQDFIKNAVGDEDKVVNVIWKQKDDGSPTIKDMKEKIRNAYHGDTYNLEDMKNLTPYNDKVSIKVGVDPANISIEKRTNDYEISAFPLQIQGKTISSIIPLVETADNGVHNFIILIDVTYLSVKRIRKQFYDKILGSKYKPADTYNVFIVSSLENDSDPAGKIRETEYTELKDDREDLKELGQSFATYKNINVFFMQEEEDQQIAYSSVYSNYQKGKGNKSLLFTNSQLKTSRTADGLISAEVTFPNGSNVVHKDLGKISEIAAASKEMSKKYIEYKHVNKKSVLDDDDKREISHYYLLKRAGDWCQALCLLDRDRKYKISKEDQSGWKPSEYGTKSINELVEALDGPSSKSRGTEVALMTHDRILLTFALEMGLNVYFTIKLTDIKKKGDSSPSAEGKRGSTMVLIYFKNLKSKKADFQSKLILDQIKNLYQVIQLKEEFVVEMQSETQSDESYLDYLKGLIRKNIANPEIETYITRLKAEIAQSNAVLDKIPKLIEVNKDEFNNLNKYILNLRKILYIGSRIDVSKIEVKTINAESTLLEIGDYISLIININNINANNKQLAANLNDANVDVNIMDFEPEKKNIKEMTDTILAETNYKKLIPGSNSASSKEWERFLNVTIKNMQSDYKKCRLNKIALAEVVPATAPEPTGRSRKNGPAAFHRDMSEYFKPSLFAGGATKGGANADDVYLTEKIIKTRIYTSPLNIVIGDLSDGPLLSDVTNNYPNNTSAILAAKYVFNEKIFEMREPDLTDYCNDVIDRFMLINPIPTGEKVEQEIDNIIDEKDAEIPHVNDKTFIERGTKLQDISEKYNTVVDDYIIDYSNSDIFYHFYNKIKNSSNPRFDNSSNKFILQYRFIIYYIDRLEEKITMYENYADKFSYRSDIKFLELEVLNVWDYLKNPEANLEKTMEIFYTERIGADHRNELEAKEESFEFDEDEYDDIEASQITPGSLTSGLYQMKRDIKQQMLIAIVNYYDKTGVKKFNTQLLESLIFNLGQAKRDFFTLVYGRNGKLIPDDFKEALVDAINVAYITREALEGNVDPIRVVATTNRLNAQSSVLKAKGFIYYARAIRLAVNKLEQQEFRRLLENGKHYLNNTDRYTSMDTEDLKALTIAQMWYVSQNPVSALSVIDIAYDLANSTISYSSPAVASNIFVELLANYIKIYWIIDPIDAKFNNLKIVLRGTKDFQGKLINLVDFNELINDYLEDLNLPIRANFA